MIAALPSSAAQAAGAVQSFDVPAQSLALALRELARQGRVQVLFSAQSLEGRRSRPVTGRIEVRSAFDLALSETGFEARRVDERTFVIIARPRPPQPVKPPAESSPAELAPVLVTGARWKTDDVERRIAADLAETAPVRRLTRDDMERGAAQNLSEALGDLPGMTVINTGRSFIGGIDSASRGEGLYAAYRGLNAEYNLSMINGVSVAQGLPYSRGIQLNLLPPGAFETVVVHKTGRADMDGDFIGAALDFRTPGPADTARAPWTAITVGGRVEARARDYGRSGVGDSARIEHGRRFGAGDRFGLYVAAAYENRGFVNSELAGVMAAQNDGGWAYRVSSSAAGGPVDPSRPQDNLVQTSMNVGVSSGGSRLRNYALALDWRAAPGFDIRLSATHAQARTEQNSTFSQVVGGPQSWIADGAGLYRLSVRDLSTRVWYETNPDEVSLSTLSLAAEAVSGRWRLAPYLFASHGQSARPDHLEASAWINQADGYNIGQAPRAFGGVTVTYRDGLPVPLWPQSVFADLNAAGPTLLARRAGQRTEQFSEQLRYGAGFGLTFLPTQGNWRSLRVGAKITRSDRDLTDRNWTNAFFADIYQTAGLTWDALGITRGTYAQVFPGLYDWSIPRVDHDRLEALFEAHRTAESFDSCGALHVNNLNCNSQSGSETVQAVYAMATHAAGAWEIQLGLRGERTRIDNRFWVMPEVTGGEAPGAWGASRSRYAKLLPSLNLSYRQGDRGIWRAAAWRSYSRPAFMQLGGGTRTETLDGVTTITRGNPDLESADAWNLDLSHQRWLPGGGAVSLSAYAKRIDHYLYESGSDLDVGATPQEDGAVRVLMPRNGGDGVTRGLEAEWFQPLGDLFALGGRASLDVNLSRQWSRVDLGEALGRSQPMLNAPNWLGNAELAYSRGRASVYLSLNYTGAYLSAYDVLGAAGDWDNLWVRPAARLDARVRWRFDDRTRLDLIMTNLTGEYSYWAHVGRDSTALSDVVDSGRRAVVSLRSIF
ncbi:TonB-dependent receptor [Caulobacter endophyticus]|uniref:TonB-dependent receptor n=1 Tax=Caulobacter endophyticus TaxID=2172652 RepID=UPI00240FB005|nr:TonB-dependent receptor [Caulobacter endophyticus]MDG2527217.1 TonB-dependent receptor [Caulobacter endophyticus]